MPIEDDREIAKILTSSRTVAVVGASDKPWRDSNDIMRFLMVRGYKVFAVNPRYKKVLDQPCYATLKDIPEPIDIVDVFRRPEAVPAIIDEAIAVKAKVLWLQLGVVHEEGAKLAEQKGIRVVMDRCIAIDHRRLIRS